MHQSKVGTRLHRAGRSTAAVMVFLTLFAGLLVFISHWYLIPSLSALKGATPIEKKKIAIYAWLILTILLFILFAALSITFRFGRFFFPRPQPPRTQTKYVDVWAEAGKRAPTPSESDPEDFSSDEE